MDEIHLPPKVNFDEPGKYYATALHELGHWTGHESRLNREGGPFGSEPYAKEELRAEIASWMLGQDIGVRHDPDQHVAYVASWIKALEEDPSEIMRACRDAEQIKEYVLGLERDKELGDERVKTPEVERPDTPEPIAAMGTPDGAQEQSAPSRPAPEKTWLSVPYREKEQAKSLGAKWDTTEKSWYAPKEADLAKLAGTCFPGTRGGNGRTGTGAENGCGKSLVGCAVSGKGTGQTSGRKVGPVGKMLVRPGRRGPGGAFSLAAGTG